jgi:hypothetical protein
VTAEFDLYGVFVQALLVWAALALLATGALRWALRRLGLYRLVWHPPLFDLALFVTLLGGITAAARWTLP